MSTTQKIVTYRQILRNSTVTNGVPGASFLSDSDVNLGFAIDEKTGTPNKDWKVKVMKMQDASSAYQTKINTGSPAVGRGSVYYVLPGFLQTVYLSYRQMGPVPELNATDSTLLDIATANFNRNRGKMTGGMEGLPPLLELKDLRMTSKGLTKLTTTMMQTLISIKKTKGRSAYKYASDAWLTYGFGIQPMLSDIRKLSASIDSYLTNKDSVSRVTGFAKRSWSTGSKSVINTHGAYNLRCHQNAHHQLSYRIVSGMKFNISASNDYTAASHLGLTPDGLPSAAWELTPMSWVADYVTTAGDFIDDTFTSKNGESIYCTVSRRYEVNTANSMFMDPTSPYKGGGGSDTSTFRYIDFQRTVLAKPPSRILRLRTLDEMGLHGLTKLTNLVTVLGNLRK